MKPIGARIPLAELDARWLRYEGPEPGEPETARHYRRVESMLVAHGISFLCPKCYQANKGAEGTHRVTCWFEGSVPDDATPGPGRWMPSGTGVADLTFVPTKARPAVSVKLLGGCLWHGFIAGGVATVPP